jgi:cysteine desulfuration protein SufE
MKLSLATRKARLLQELSRLQNSQDRLAWLVDQARKRPLLEAALRTDAHRVEGCLSRLWLVREFRQGRCHFRCESDSLIVKAIAGLLCDLYTGQPPDEILTLDPGFLAEVGITQHLTPNRRNALARVWELIRAFAAEHQASASRPASGPPP